jgi:drug/metabolite transporter (DMT)-like permease
MFSHAAGQLFAIATTLLWATSATLFEAAGRRIGSINVNLLRLSIAAVLLAGLCFLSSGSRPVDAPPHVWTWMLLSGLLGFFLCDLLLFRAYVMIGARRSALMLSLAPVFAAVLDLVLIGKPLTLMQGVGMLITLSGVLWVIAERPDDEAPHTRRERQTGALFAGLAALLQALGALTAKIGMRLPDGNDFDPIAATFIRSLAGVAGFALLVVLSGRSRRLIESTRDGRAMALLTAGAVAGPVLGVSCFLASLQRVPAGITQTILATIPVVLIPVAALKKHERITWRAIAGAVIAVSGVIVLCLT